jgi:serine/threonine-protein kinase
MSAADRGDAADGESELPATLVTALERACDHFEAACRAGLRPRIEDYLGEMPEVGREALAREMRALERAYRDRAATAPAPTAEPPTEPTAPGPAERRTSGSSMADYEILGELGRGGMGKVLKARDLGLGRDLALKILLDSHRERTDLVDRFVEEAQICGQLQHPGVVPVYELGTLADRRPYFTMKLVGGRTLAALLREREDAKDDLARFLGIFEQVCQTVAYAHARGVIHRDLKPSNVMVGSFGEVQVMDWGLAKVLQGEGGADKQPHQPAPEGGMIRTARSGSDVDVSQLGSVLGTPAYMAPEQAGGDVEHVDRRADVFGLGSILCEILTGQPAYTGRTPSEVLRTAMQADLADALVRLDACGAEAELVALARDCLVAQPEGRPRNAGVVAGRMAAYLAGVQERLRSAERERAVAVARALEERRRRKLQLGLAASVLASATIVGLGGTYLLHQRQARAAARDRVLGQVTSLRDQARTHPDEVARWQLAMAAVRQAEGALGGATEAMARLRELRSEVQAGADAAETDRRLLDELVDIRSARADDPDGSATEAAYARAFREAGIDVAVLPSNATATMIAARPLAVALPSAAALDHWAAVRRARRDTDGARYLTAAARSADPDPWRNQLRDALDQPKGGARTEALRRLADSVPFDTLPAGSLDLLGQALKDTGELALAESVLRRAQWKHPGDVWLNYDLALCLEKRARREVAIRYYTAARAIRPESAHELAHALQELGEADEAITVFQELARLRPGSARHRLCLGRGLLARGREEEGRASLEKAIELCRESLRLRPDDSWMHRFLGNALSGLKKYDQAIAAYRAALRLKPDDADTHFTLGNLLDVVGQIDEAIAEYKETLRLQPDDAEAHGYLGGAYFSRGQYDDAAREYREALRLRPDNPEVHCNLGQLLQRQGRFAEAIVELERGHELGTKRVGWPHPSADWVKKAKRQADLETRLPGLLEGTDRPADTDEILLCAELCSSKQLLGASARFRSDAMRSRPALTEDLQAGHRYNAACIAARAGRGEGEDRPPLGEAERARWRKQALAWLRSDLAAWTDVLERDKQDGRARVAQTLDHWKRDGDLAGLRDPTAVGKLPEDEKKACRDFWHDVEGLLAQARGPSSR